MKQEFVMALDAGTGSFRAIVYDLSGKQIALNQTEWTHAPDPKYPGSINFDTTKCWHIIVKCIRDLLTKFSLDPEDIKGISTTSMREGFVLYDEDKTELIAFSNVDARSVKEASFLKEHFPELEQELYLKTGQTFALSAIPRLLWVKNNQPEIYERIKYINMLNDWIVFKLTGKITSEPSNSSTSGLFDLKTRSWLPEVAEACQIKSDIFPPVLESGYEIGSVSSQTARLTGLSVNTKVIAGGGDAQLGCIGSGSVKPNQATLFGGSFWQYEYNIATPTPDPKARIRVNCHAAPNLWQYEAIAWNAGLVMRWYRDAFCQAEKKTAKEQGISVYTLLDQEAAKIPPGSNGMLCTFADTMNFKNLKHAAPTFTNFMIESDQFNKFTFYRSIMENAGLVSYSHMKMVESLTGITPEKIIFAGGSSYSSLWSQIVCDIMGIPLVIPSEKEATALGAAILAGLGTGLFESMKDAQQMIQFEQTLVPNEENHKEYKKLFKTWQKVYQTQLQLSDDAVTNYMWIAPGVK